MTTEKFRIIDADDSIVDEFDDLVAAYHAAVAGGHLEVWSTTRGIIPVAMIEEVARTMRK